MTSVASISNCVTKYVAVYIQVSVGSKMSLLFISPETNAIDTVGTALSNKESVITTFSNETVPVLVTVKV